MPKLYLLRHAEAPGSFDVPDKQRPLSAHGIKQAERLNNALAGIDIALCSSAKRTRMTLQGAIDSGASVNKIEYLDALYNASASGMLEIIQSQTVDNILIIAHNPGIHALANMLIGDGDKSLRNKLAISYHPATLSIIECESDSWQTIQPAANTLIDLIIPD